MKKQFDPLAVAMIDAFGGTADMARLCGCTMSAVSRWKRNGIPPGFDLYLRTVKPTVYNRVFREVMATA